MLEVAQCFFEKSEPPRDMASLICYLEGFLVIDWSWFFFNDVVPLVSGEMLSTVIFGWKGLAALERLLMKLLLLSLTDSIMEASSPISCFQIFRMSSRLPPRVFKNVSSRSMMPSNS